MRAEELLERNRVGSGLFLIACLLLALCIKISIN